MINQTSYDNISKNNVRMNLKKQHFVLVGLLPENCHSVASLQQLQRHKAILNLLQNHQMQQSGFWPIFFLSLSFFFYQDKLATEWGPAAQRVHHHQQ